MIQVAIGLGTNLGDKEAQLNQAVKDIEKRIGHVVALSSFIYTEPWGFESEHQFLNAAVLVETALSPEKLLKATQQIEKRMGRNSKSVGGVYKDRVIDIDILLYGDEIIENETLNVPHPLLQERAFVLEPLAEIIPEYVHPVLQEKIQTLWDRYKEY